MANIFEFLSKDGNITPEKHVNRDKCSFATKQRMFGVFAIDEPCSPDHALYATLLLILSGRSNKTTPLRSHCMYNTTSLVVIPSTSKNLTPCAPGAGGHWAPSHVFAYIHTKFKNAKQ